MLTQDHIRVAIIMAKRAKCTGEEALSVAQTILALEAQYELFARNNDAEESNGDD